MARATGSFLLPWLFATTGNLSTIFDMCNVFALVRLHRNHDLVHEISIPFCAKDFLGECYLPCLFSFCVVHSGFHVSIYLLMISTIVPRRPGIAPLTSSVCPAAST